MIELSAQDARVRLVCFANGGARCTVAAYEVVSDGYLALPTDCLNLNNARERARWLESLPEELQPSANELGQQLGLRVEEWRATANTAKAQAQTTRPQPDEPWPDAVPGAALLDELTALCARYLVLPMYGAVVLALWLMHTYVADLADYTPYIHVSSPVRGCGKSILLRVLEALAFRARRTDSITAAALYRTIEEFSPSLLLDELDTQIKEHSESSEHLRGILNSGFQRGGRRTLCVGDQNETRDFRTYCPKVLAGIGRLWDTVASRSIRLPMEKASRAELRKIQKMRGDRINGICEPARRKLMRWANDARAELADADPDVPEVLEARQADVWRALLAIADLAGGDWPSRTRAAAVALAGATQEESDYGLLALEDVRALFPAADPKNPDRLPSSTIVLELAKREDRPWPEYRHDKPITTTQLARLLGRFGIKPKNIRLAGADAVVKGYERAECTAAFEKYLPAIPDITATAATDSPASVFVAAVAAKNGVPLGKETSGPLPPEPTDQAEVAVVAAKSEVPLEEVNQYELDERAGMQEEAHA